MIDSVTVKVEGCDSYESAYQELSRAAMAAVAPELADDREFGDGTTRTSMDACVIELEQGRGWKGRTTLSLTI